MKKYIYLVTLLIPIYSFSQTPCDELDATGTVNGLNFTSTFNGQIDSWLSYDNNGTLLEHDNQGNTHNVSLFNKDGLNIDSFTTCIYWNKESVCCILFTSDGSSWSGAVSSPPTSIEYPHSSKRKKLIKVIDFSGRKTKSQFNAPLIEIYDDGSIEKKLIIDK